MALWIYDKLWTVIAYTSLLFSPKNKLLGFSTGQYFTSEHASISVPIVRKKNIQRKIPEQLFPLCKSPCGTLQSDPAPSPSHCSTPRWEIIFCLGSRLFSSRCANVIDLHFSSWWQQCAHWLLRIATVFTLHCSNLDVPTGPWEKMFIWISEAVLYSMSSNFNTVVRWLP